MSKKRYSVWAIALTSTMVTSLTLSPVVRAQDSTGMGSTRFAETREESSDVTPPVVSNDYSKYTKQELETLRQQVQNYLNQQIIPQQSMVDAKLAELAVQEQTKKNDLAERSAEMDALLVALKEKKQKFIDEVQKEIDQESENARTLESAYEELVQQKETLETQKTELSDKVQAIQKLLEDSGRSQAYTKEELDQKQAEVNAAKKELDAANEALAQAQAQVKQLEDQLQEVNQNVDTTTSTLEEKKSAVEALEAKSEELNTQLQQATAEYQEKKAALDAKKEGKTQLEQEIQALEDKHLDDQIAEKDAQLQQINQQIDEVTQQLQTMQQERATKEQKLANVQQQLQEIETLKAQLDQKKQELDEKEQAVTQAKQAYDSKQQDLNATKAQLKQIQDNRKPMQDEVDALKTQAQTGAETSAVDFLTRLVGERYPELSKEEVQQKVDYVLKNIDAPFQSKKAVTVYENGKEVERIVTVEHPYDKTNDPKVSPFHIDNLEGTIPVYRKLNELRKQNGLKELPVSIYLVATAMRNISISKDMFGHTSDLNVGENVAWAQKNADEMFRDWYTKEKETYDKYLQQGLTPEQIEQQHFFEVGHYLNIIQPEYVRTGMAMVQGGEIVDAYDPSGYATANTFSRSADDNDILLSVDELEQAIQLYKKDPSSFGYQGQSIRDKLEAMQESTNQVTTLKAQQATQEQELQTLQTALTQAQQAVTPAREAMNAAQQQYDEKQAHQQELEEQVEQLQEEIEVMKGDEEQPQQDLEQAQQAKTQTQQQRTALTQEKETLTQKKKELEDWDTAFATLQAEVQTAEQAKQTAEQKAQENSTSLQAAQQEVSTLQQKLNEFSQKQGELQAQLDPKKQDVEEKQEQQQEAEQTHQALQTELDTMNQLNDGVQNLSTLQQTLADVTQQLDQKNTAVVAKKAEVDASNQKIATAKARQQVLDQFEANPQLSVFQDAGYTLADENLIEAANEEAGLINAYLLSYREKPQKEEAKATAEAAVQATQAIIQEQTQKKAKWVTERTGWERHLAKIDEELAKRGVVTKPSQPTPSKPDQGSKRPAEQATSSQTVTEKKEQAPKTGIGAPQGIGALLLSVVTLGALRRRSREQ